MRTDPRQYPLHLPRGTGIQRPSPQHLEAALPDDLERELRAHCQMRDIRPEEALRVAVREYLAIHAH